MLNGVLMKEIKNEQISIKLHYRTMLTQIVMLVETAVDSDHPPV